MLFGKIGYVQKRSIMIGIKEKAEVYKLGLLIGYFSLEEFLRWIDETIEKEESPDIGLVEIAFSSSKDIKDIISLIGEISGSNNLKTPVRILLGLMYKDFLNKKISLNGITCKLYLLSLHLTEENIDEKIIYEFNTMEDYHFIYTNEQIRHKLDDLLNQYLNDDIFL